MKKSVKIVSLITGVLVFSGIVGFAATQEISGLKFAVVIIGIGVGIISTLVERKSKLLFYVSIMIIIIGDGMISAYQGYINPIQLDHWEMVTDLESFYPMFTGYLFHNTYIAFESLVGGPTIIFPYFSLYINITNLFNFIGSLIAIYGFKGVVLALGWLNIYPEFAGIILAIMASIRVALESFKAFTSMGKEGFMNSLMKIRDVVVFEIINTMPKVVALLLIAAVLETLWTHFWVNYWLQHIL